MNTRSLLAAAALTFSALTNMVNATHNMGREVSYRWLGGLDYEFTVVQVNDCQGLVSPPSMWLWMRSISCGYLDTLIMPLVDTVEVPTGCDSWLTTCNGGTVPGAWLLFYRDTMTLAGNCPDWSFGVEECCRNGSIVNLMNPWSYGMWVDALLDNVAVPGNSSPVFQEFPPVLFCLNRDICVPNTGYDEDGDSLVFSIAQPRTHSYPPTAIPFAPGYSLSNPFPSSSGHVFDPVTGNHCAMPSMLGQYVLAYDVDEFRAGTWIGRAHREFTVSVVNCPATSMTVHGVVTDTLGNPVTGGTAELFEYGSNAAGSLLVGTAPVDPLGNYSFTGVPAQQYIVRAVPSAGYPGTATSYHRNTYYWTYADVLYSSCDTSVNADIELVPATNLSGSGYVAGFLGDLGIIRDDGPGVPWENVGIILERWPERGLMAYTRTDVDGHWSFNGVPDGTYRVICDHPGLGMLGFYVITIGGGVNDHTGLNYGADPGGFHPTGITTLVAGNTGSQVVLSPNPALSNEVVMTGLADGTEVLSIIDASGRTVRREQVTVTGAMLRMNVQDLPSGLYTLTLERSATRVGLVIP